MKVKIWVWVFWSFSFKMCRLQAKRGVCLMWKRTWDVCSTLCSCKTVWVFLLLTAQRLRNLIEEALGELLSSSHHPSGSTSRNHIVATSMGSLQSNIIFDGANTLPKEVMLETTLKVLDYNYDIFEVGLRKQHYCSLFVLHSIERSSKHFISRWEWRGRASNRSLMLSLETTGFFQIPFPEFCIGWRTKLGYSEKFLKKKPRTQRDSRDRFSFVCYLLPKFATC